MKYFYFSIEIFHDGGRYYIETSPLIFQINGLGFYMIAASVMKELNYTVANYYILSDI